ncbi:MAG: ATP-dependent zinc metalloprotease FtsH [Chloroflexi bacterium]|nr:ATP-dependent zinc metalloprotease FtsH [Chloroflexota bacterium]MYF80642.1 ATP-dependent zinc metalloprotease FtsH [Chloroflexota bacterium]MYI04649.1 ATP-dependent zinc metalloprotease FtsH [Chloroflexota bacterium]
MGGSRFKRSFLIYLLIFVVLIIVVFSVFPRGGGSNEIPLAGGTESLLGRIENGTGTIETIEVSSSKVTLVQRDGGQSYETNLPETGFDFFEFLAREGIDVGAQGFPDVEVSGGGGFGSTIAGLFFNLLPILLIVGLIFFFLRQAQGQGSQAMSFGKSKARMVTANRPSVTFNDVAGCDEAKEELQEVVEFLKFPERFASLGARIPRGCLLVGPPGTGKTLIARAVAGEAGVPFFSISGSEFVEMFVGVGASRVRDLFEQAKRNAPCIVFVDEIDAVGRQRGAGVGGSHDEREQTLNQILVEMDGFDTNTNVIVVAATNRPDILDPALLRPGRFDRRVVLDAPDVKGRVAILDVHVRGKPLAEEVDLHTIAKETPGFSGAELANLLNEAAILAARRQKKHITQAEVEEAVDRVMAGPERKSRLLVGREKEVVAFHEAGHALVASHIPGHDPVHKVTIVPRGMAGGYTRYLPESEHRLAGKSYYEGFMASALGGHAAEEVVFGEMTTGAHDDLSKVTQIARAMITQWGMSERLGARTFGKKESMVFLGRDISEQRDYSEMVAEQIDEELREIIDRARDRARTILRRNREQLDLLATRLMEVETLEGDDLRAILAWQPGDAIPEPTPPPPAPDPTPPPAAPPSSEADDEREPLMPPKPGLAWGGNQNSSSLDS